MPKSMSFGTVAPLVWARKMFSGFTSRWTMPWRCAAARPSTTGPSSARASGHGSGARASSSARSSRPSSSSCTMYQPPSGLWPASSTSTMFGCVTRVAARASRRKRSGAVSTLAARGSIALSATRRPVTTFSAS